MRDAHLLKSFPGRTLEELDNMDWGRFRAAEIAMRIADVETVRLEHVTGRLKYEQINPKIWDAIAEHERILTANGR